VDNDSAEVTGKAWLATVVNLTSGTARCLVPAERRGRGHDHKSPCQVLFNNMYVANFLSLH